MADRRFALAIVCLFGCSSPPPSKLPRSNLLRYSASGAAGGTSFVVRQNGTVAYESTVEGKSLRIDGKVTQEELDGLVAALHESECCSLSSQAVAGKLEEPRPSYSVRVGDLDCEIALWASEVASSREAQACVKALDDFGAKVAKKATLTE